MHRTAGCLYICLVSTYAHRYVSTHAYAPVHTFVYAHAYIDACRYLYRRLYRRLYTCLYTCPRACLYTCQYTCQFACLCPCVHKSLHMCRHTPCQPQETDPDGVSTRRSMPMNPHTPIMPPWQRERLAVERKTRPTASRPV